MDPLQVAHLRVLIVDDEPDSIEVVRMVLSAAGATVYEAAEGREGLEIYRREQPNVILTDLSMPDLDGWQLLETIRASDNGQAVPVIALTAHAMVGDKERVMVAGFTAYMSKPLKMFTFMEDLRRCLANAQNNPYG